MAILILNDDDFSGKLQNFRLNCKNCGSSKVTLDIDWAAYPSCSWLNVNVICEECKHDEEIYSTD